jgi:protein-S-isoprenylcysteine O-methyltransferase Ste14
MGGLPLWPLVFVFPLGACFYYFMLAGARTFEIAPDDDLSSGIGQFCFLVTGTLGTIFLGYRAEVSTLHAVAGGILMACALALYEWARHTIAGRRFAIAWSIGVPEAVCETGPYRYVRHPSYASYILAFAAQSAALPSPWTAAIFVFNAAVFAHASRADERTIAGSDLATEYARYKQRVGRFLPRLGKKPPE